MIGNILITEDNQEFALWLKARVCSSFPEPHTKVCVSYKNTIKYLINNKPDLALVDINLPDGSGLHLIQPILQRSPNAHVVVITIIDDQESIFAAIQQGATGYLLKDLPEESFMLKLEGILEGEPPLSPSVARLILQYCAKQAKDKPLSLANPIDQAQLTKKEVEVLVLIAKGFSRKESGKILNVSESTIATHVRHIYRKLDISSRAEAALIAARMGLVCVDTY